MLKVVYLEAGSDLSDHERVTFLFIFLSSQRLVPCLTNGSCVLKDGPTDLALFDHLSRFLFRVPTRCGCRWIPDIDNCIYAIIDIIEWIFTLALDGG